MSYDPADAARQLTRQRQRAQRERRRQSPQRRRNFAPPGGRDNSDSTSRAITTTRQLLRSWSRRTNRLCLNTSILVNRKPSAVSHRSLTAEVANQHPGSWEKAYKEGLAKLFQDEIGCDIVFRVAGSNGNDEAIHDVVKAHRHIVGNRKQEMRFGHRVTWNLLNDERGVASTSDDKHPPSQWQAGEDILVNDYIFTDDPEQLRTAVASCYGIRERGKFNKYCLEDDIDEITQDIMELNPLYWNEGYVPTPWQETDVSIIASPGASAETEEAWTIDCHAALLMAHSDYFCALLAGRGWATEQEESSSDNNNSSKRIVRLDSLHFGKDTVEELVNGLYSDALDVCEEDSESILHLIDAAAYLGIKTASLRCEEALALRIDAEHLVDYIHFAQDHGAELLLLECHKFLCRNLAAVNEAGTLAQLERPQLEAMLQSNFIETPEDEILDSLMTWADATSASLEETKELMTLIRLAFVPVDSPVMAKAISKELVTQDMLRVVTLFQTDGDYRETMMNNDPLYRPRQTKTMTKDLEAKLRPAPVPRRIRPRICRMLGVVNGRNNFDKISSVQPSDCQGHLVCTEPFEPLDTEFQGDFDFDLCKTLHMNDNHNLQQPPIGRAELANLPIEKAKELLARMLQRENALRLHPLVQQKLGSIGEDEEEMSTFTTALQVFVCNEFSVDPVIGVEFIRSATSLFPEIAQLAHYVKHNRCFAGTLNVGDEAPDVKLSTLEGKATTLWSEVEKRRCFTMATSDDAVRRRPVVILGASYT